MIMEVNQILIVEKMGINPSLDPSQQAHTVNIIHRHKDRFRGKLSEVGELKADPYERSLKEGAHPIKVVPYTLPRDANE